MVMCAASNEGFSSSPPIPSSSSEAWYEPSLFDWLWYIGRAWNGLLLQCWAVRWPLFCYCLKQPRCSRLHPCFKKWHLFRFWITRSKMNRFRWYLVHRIQKTFDTNEFKFVHRTWKVSPCCLVKCRPFSSDHSLTCVTKQNTLTVQQLHYFSCVQETFQFTLLRNYIQLKPCYRNKTLTAYVHFGLSCVQNAAFGSDVGTKMFHHMICWSAEQSPETFLVSHFHKFIDNLRNLAAKFTHDLMYRHCSEFSNCLVFGNMVVHNCHELHEHNVVSLFQFTTSETNSCGVIYTLCSW